MRVNKRSLHNTDCSFHVLFTRLVCWSSRHAFKRIAEPFLQKSFVKSINTNETTRDLCVFVPYDPFGFSFSEHFYYFLFSSFSHWLWSPKLCCFESMKLRTKITSKGKVAWTFSEENNVNVGLPHN